VRYIYENSFSKTPGQAISKLGIRREGVGIRFSRRKRNKKNNYILGGEKSLGIRYNILRSRLLNVPNPEGGSRQII